jgi:hypothetical protein
MKRKDIWKAKRRGGRGRKPDKPETREQVKRDLLRILVTLKIEKEADKLYAMQSN